MRGLFVRAARPGQILDQLGRIESPTLVCVGELDPVTPVGAAREILESLRGGIGQLEVIPRAGHWAWRLLQKSSGR